MDTVDCDWKKKVGFPINYNSGQSSDDEFGGQEEVVMRHPRRSSQFLLADGGDGSEADLLGSTPPRSRIRNKEKRRTVIDSGTSLQRLLRDKRDALEYVAPEPSSPGNERLKKRASLKLIRGKERDWKQELGQRDSKADSLPSPAPASGPGPGPVPTLVESCSRFMSLRSTAMCRGPLAGDDADADRPEPGAAPAGAQAEPEERWLAPPESADPPASRVTFHRTFSMLINMGNVDKGCRRTISREEQVWQNELKDLIWLELKARLAGRTLAQQDAQLCAQRAVVPALIQNIFNYRFVNDSPCPNATGGPDAAEDASADGGDEPAGGSCLALHCGACSAAVGRGMREVSALLDSFHSALSLYPSSTALTNEHPLVATHLFQNRMKAMCLWFNTALNLRLKMLGMRRLLRSMRLKIEKRRTSLVSDASAQSSAGGGRACRVQFSASCNATPTESSGSELSAHEDSAPDPAPDPAPARPRHEPEHEQDDTDSGIHSSRQSQTGQTTPELVLPDSAYSSNDSGGGGGGGVECGGNWWSYSDVFELGDLQDLTHLRLLGKCPVSLYREHHREILKTQGVRRCMMYLYKMRKHVLDKAFLTLDGPGAHDKPDVSEEEPVEMFAVEERGADSAQQENTKRAQELRRYGCWSEECTAMRLPSYRSHFLLLSSICMEAVHDYLAFRLESRPDHPSCLTVKQLIHELKEGLDIASEMRAEFMRHVRAAARAPLPAPELRLLLHAFDDTADAVLKQYLSYLRTMSETEHMGRACLQAEWEFTARLAKRIRCAALLAPLAFSEIACNQLKRLRRVFEEKFKLILDAEEADQEKSRHGVYLVCRLMQGIYAEEREGVLQGAQWARALAARLARAPPPAYLHQRVQIFNSLMSIRDFIVKSVEIILDKSQMTTPEEIPKDMNEGVTGRIRELLLQVFKLGFELHRELYLYSQAPHKLAQEREQRRRSRPASLQPLRAAPLHGARPRRRPDTVLLHESFNPMMHKELHRFARDGAATGRVRAGAGCGAGGGGAGPGPARRLQLLRADSVLEECAPAPPDDKLFENNCADSQPQVSIELLLGGGGAEREVRAEESAWAARVARAVIQFAKCWMKFVVERCDRGRGTRPRWASQGLEFLMLACDPGITRHLSEGEFEELKQLMDGCISHVIGSRGGPAPRPACPPSPAECGAPATSPRPRHRLHSPLCGGAGAGAGAAAAWPGAAGAPGAASGGREVPTPPTPPSEADPLLCFNTNDSLSHARRVAAATQQLEARRERLLRDARSVGRVLEAAVASYEPRLRQLTFKWQRGLKIGAGSFGKVYTVVNTESGQLLAMKELSIGAGDRRLLQRAANELQVLEGVVHPHLVRYYGCELHREEMLLFMELCVEGSLEALVGTSGALPEHTTRRYTKQLLSALQALHQRSIAHRDVKSGNIFLTNEGHCLKLGDFGCAVKIRAHTTAPCELQGFVGTQAYMAPEVFMNPAGHGRAADVWSLGCVVTEMASGKRPFSEHDYSNYHIMFKVGMGERPHIPDSLSEEGRQFCMSCLTHDPDRRPRAEALALHTFLMVKADDDCSCEPAYLIA